MMDTKKTPSASRRIAIVVDNLDPRAGWGRLATEVGDGLGRMGWDVRYVVSQGSCSDQITVANMRDLGMHTPLRLARALIEIRRAIRNREVVLCFDTNPYGTLTSIASLGTGVKVVIDALGTYSLFTKSRLRNALIAWTYRRADRVLIVSDFVRRAIERSGFRFRAFDLVPVGVDLTRFVPSSAPKGEYVLTVGAVKHRKGYHLTIPAFIEIAREFPNLRYVIVGALGEGAYCASIEAMIRDAKLQNRVEFRADVSDESLIALYQSARVYLQTSVTDDDSIEGFGMSYLEAGACGTPSIGARESGAEAAIVDGETGYLVPHDVSAISDALRMLLKDPTRTDSMGRTALRNAERFAWSHVVEMYARHMTHV